MFEEEKKEYEELKSLLYTGTISQYGKRKLIDLIENQQKELDKYKMLLAESTATRVVTSIKDSKKAKEDLEMLNRGWQKELDMKDKIIDKLLNEITAVNSGRYEYMDNDEVLEIFTKKAEVKEND